MNSILIACLAVSLSIAGASAQSGPLAEASQSMKSGDYAGARQVLEQFIEKTPRQAEAHNLLGVCLRELNDTAGSIAEFRTAVKLAPRDENARFNLGSTLLSVHDEAGALSAFSELIRIDPKSVEGHMALARMRLASHEESAALPELETVIQLDPHDTFALANAGLIESRQGQLDKAARYVAAALAENPESRPLQLALVELDLRRGRVTEAVAQSDKIISAASLTPAEKQTLAALLWAQAKQNFQTNQFQATVSLLAEVVKLRPPDAALDHLLGLAWYEMGNIEKASAALQAAIHLDPTNPRRYLQLGFIYLKERTPALAQIVFEHGLEEAPNSAPLWLWMGLSQHLADDSVRAQQSVEKALSIDPGLVEGYLVLGDILESDGRLSEASGFFRRAIEKKPDLSIGYYYCGKVALEAGNGQTQEALSFLTKAVALDPEFAEAHYEKGRALEQAGQLRQAVAEYNTCLTKNRNLPQAHYRLALVYRKLGETGTAENQLALFQKTKLKEKDTVLERLEYQIQEQ